MSVRAPAVGPRGLTTILFGKLMETAVPLDRNGDERIEELLCQLRDERDRRTKKKVERNDRAR